MADNKQIMLRFSRTNAGSALFLILIAVALFAALAYAVTQSSRGGGSTTKEQVVLNAARIIQFANMVSTGYTRITLVGGLGATGVRMNNDVSLLVDGTPNMGAMGTPADPSPYLFHSQGGAVVPLKFLDISSPCAGCAPGNTAPGHFAIIWINIPGVGGSSTTTGPDIALYVLGLTDAICREINKSLGIGYTILSLGVPGSLYVYNGGQPTIALSTGADIATVTGKMDFCYVEQGSPYRNIYTSVFRVY